MARRIYDFEGFQLVAATRELRRPDGSASLLPSRVFDCIHYLIEQRSRAVGRDELIAAVWNQPEVGDNALAQLLARVRKMLDDAGDEQRVIRTLPGFGYHWVAETRALDVEESPSPHAMVNGDGDAARGAAAPAIRARFRPAGLVAGGFVLIACIVAVTLYLRKADVRAPSVSLPPVQDAAGVPVAQRPALVLPAVVTSAPGEDWMRLGIMAYVAERLGQSGRAVVPSDNSVALTRGMDMTGLAAADLSRLADSAGANWIVQPRIEAIGRRWKVTLDILHGDAPMKLKVSAESAQALDAAREATDRLLAAVGEGGAAPLASGADPALTLVLKRAQAAYLDGKPEQARELLEAARKTFPDSIELSYELGKMEYTTGRLDDAQRQFEALIAATSSPDQVVARSRAMIALARVRYQRRDLADVRRYAQQVIDLLKDRTDGLNELGRAWGELAGLDSSAGRYEESFRNAARARVLLAASGDWLEVARTDAETGVTLEREGRFAESVAVLSRAADRLQTFHEDWLEGVMRCHIMAAWTDLAEPASALKQEDRLRELDGRIEHPGMRASAKLARADVLLDNGLDAAAARLVADAYPAIVGKDDRLNLYFAHALAARVALVSGKPETAEREATEAIEQRFDPDEPPRHVAQTYLMLVRLQAAHDTTLAAQTARSLAAYLESAHVPALAAYRYLADAAVRSGDGGAETVRAAFEKAADTPGLAPLDRLRVAEAYVPWLIAHEDLNRAAEIVGRLGDTPYRNFDAAVLEVRLYRAKQERAAWQAALDRARALANERQIDPALLQYPDAE